MMLLYIVPYILLRLLPECRTLWGEREQAIDAFTIEV